MTTTTVADRVDSRLKATVPSLLGLATTVVCNSDAIEQTSTVMRSLLDYPPSEQLLAKGLRLLAETADALADALDEDEVPG